MDRQPELTTPRIPPEVRESENWQALWRWLLRKVAEQPSSQQIRIGERA